MKNIELKYIFVISKNKKLIATSNCYVQTIFFLKILAYRKRSASATSKVSYASWLYLLFKLPLTALLQCYVTMRNRPRLVSKSSWRIPFMSDEKIIIYQYTVLSLTPIYKKRIMLSELKSTHMSRVTGYFA